MTVDITLVTAAIGILIPLLNALVTHIKASGAMKSAVAVVLATLGSIATWATGITGNVSVKQLVFVAIGALAVAGGARVSFLSGVEGLVASTVPGGLGNPAAPAPPPVPTPTVVVTPAP